MFKGERKRDSLWLFLAPLVVVVVIFALLVLPYAVTETYGLKEKKLVSLMTSVVLTVFAVDMLVFWIVRYRQTGQEIEMIREEIEQTRLFHTRQREIWEKSRQRHSKR